jgi:hypothetical protein
LDPIEKPSKRCAKSRASTTFAGISHIMWTSSPFAPRRRPSSAITARTWSASRSERLALEMLYRELPNSGILTISFHPGLDPLHDRKIVLNRRPDAGGQSPQSQSKRAGSQPRWGLG